MAVGSVNSTQRPPDRANVALFYAASSPTQVFNQAAQQVAAAQGRSLSDNARALALINMATSDSLVASFFNKYRYNFWRPETAIHAGDSDSNPNTTSDSTWSPFIVDSVLPELSFEPRQCSQCCGGSHEAHLRRFWTLDHFDKPRSAHHRLAIHIVRANYRGHL